MTLANKIKEYSNKININKIGITNAYKLHTNVPIIKKAKLDNFLSYSLNERIDPKLSLKTAKSIIMIGVYHNYELSNTDKKKFKVAKSARNIDYHDIIKNKLNLLKNFLNTQVTNESIAFVDTGPLLEREFASKAGLGYLAKNMSLLSNDFSSYLSLGYIISDIELEIDKAYQNNLCEDCNICIKACPNQALNDDYTVNHEKCLSYISQNKKRVLDENSFNMKAYIFGCDICVDICPYSKNLQKLENNLDNNFDIEEFFYLSNKEFQKKYYSKAFTWRGKRILQENLLINLLNQKNDFSNYIIEKLRTDERDYIKSIIKKGEDYGLLE